MNQRELVETALHVLAAWRWLRPARPAVGDAEAAAPGRCITRARGLALAGGTGQLLFQPPGGKDHGAQRSGSRPLNGVLALRRGREEPKAEDQNQISHKNQISHVHAEAIWCILAN